MSELINERVSFGHGFVQARDRVRVIARFDDMAEQGSAASMLMMWGGEGRGWRHFELGWTAIRVACSDSAMFALGADGRVLVADGRGVREERVAGSEGRGALTDLGLVEGAPIVVGEGAQAFRRDGEDRWVELGDGLPGGEGAPTLTAVDSAGTSETYTAGEGGAIWRLDGDRWQPIDCPTDQTLNAIRVPAAGRVLAVGQGGVLVRGDGGRVEVSGEPAPEDLLGVEQFGELIYASGERGIYVLGARGGLERVHVFDGPSWTHRHLHAGGGTLWSFGNDHLIWTTDGEHWNLLRSPFQSIDPTECGPGGGASSCGCGSEHHHH
jgi:hypothetical protein